MCCREDYYKFANQIVPEMVFNNGRLLVYRLLRNETMFLENLKRFWKKIELAQPQLRNDPPDFKIDIIQFDGEHTGIILSIPSTMEEQEIIYIGITYDKDDNFRYFTYEIDKKTGEDKMFCLCEITPDFKHINYGTYSGKDSELFVKELSQVLVYELF